MRKFPLLLICMLLTSPAYGADDAVARLEAQADNINTISPEQQAKILNSVNKKNYYKVNHYSPQKLKAIMKFKNDTEKRYARQNNQEYQEPEPIDVNDKIGLKYYFKKDINLDVAKPINNME